MAATGLHARRQRAHLLQLGLGGHLLGDERGLDAVEEALEPADELGLRDAQLGVGGLLVLERQGDPLQLGDELGGEAVLELGDRAVVDLGEAGAAAVVERAAAHLLEELLDHRPDAHHLGRLLDEVGRVARTVVAGAVVVVLRGAVGDTHAVGRDDDDAVGVADDGGGHLAAVVVGLVAAGLVGHDPILPRTPRSPSVKGATSRRPLTSTLDMHIVCR